MNDLKGDFIKKLDIARQVAKVPFVLTSAYRSEEWEKKQGRDGTSSHTKGIAVDIKCSSSNDRFRIFNGLISVGFSRIGIGKNFIHVDLDKDKTSSVAWTYYE
jgi:uncharacterized protein YcbK (DUF882 family)